MNWYSEVATVTESSQGYEFSYDETGHAAIKSIHCEIAVVNSSTFVSYSPPFEAGLEAPFCLRTATGNSGLSDLPWKGEGGLWAERGRAGMAEIKSQDRLKLDV